jgi:hypothetical protein
MAAEYAILKARRESLDLGFNTTCHIGGRTIRHVAICPGNVTTRGCPAWIEKRRLRQNDERLLRVPAIRYRPFRRGDFPEGSAHVDRAGSAANFA